MTEPFYSEKVSPHELNTRHDTKYSIAEIKKYVFPAGTCKGLDLQVPSNEHHSAGVQKIRTLFTRILNDKTLLEQLITKSKEDSIEISDVQNSLEITDDSLAHRISYILNFGIDPEFLPQTISQRPNVPQAFIKHISTNESSRDKLCALMLDEYTREQGRENVDLKTYIETVLTQVDSDHTVGLEEANQTKRFIEDMFQLPSLKQSLEELGQITGETYLEEKEFIGGPYNETLLPIRLTPEMPGLTHLRKYLKALQKGEYIYSLYQDVKQACRELLPEVYTEPYIRSITLNEIHPVDVDTLPIDIRDKFTQPISHGNFDYGYRMLNLESVVDPATQEQEDLSQEAYITGGLKIRRRVGDTALLVHEFMHSIYDAFVHDNGLENAKDLLDTYKKSADHALNEGFAVLMEIIFMDLLGQNPDIFGFDNKDTKDLKVRMYKRLLTLARQKKKKRKDDRYAEGTFRIMHTIYAEAAGPPSQRDMHKGLVAVREFLESIDPKKALSTSIDDPRYQKLLKNPSTEGWKRLFGREGEKI